MEDLAFLPALEQAALVRAREVSPVELVELYLRRIERLDPESNAYVTVAAEGALADARRPLPDEPPVGVQLVGPLFGEALLLRLAAQLERARPWTARRPPHA